jgi:tetratricopeptide (TPR) repeat protein
MGYIYQRWNRDGEAVQSYREALRRNSREIGTFVLIGDVFFNRNQLEMARKYYEASLKLKPSSRTGAGQANCISKTKNTQRPESTESHETSAL